MHRNAGPLALSFVLTVYGLCLPAASPLSAGVARADSREQARPAGADKVDAIAQKFRGTHDIAGAAEALADAAGRSLIYGYGARNDSGMGLVRTTPELLDQRTMICYEFVHLSAYLAGNQLVSSSGSPRLGPGAATAYLPRTYTTWDGASVIPRGQVIVFVARAYNNDAGYYHIGISLGGGKMIHFPAEGGVQTTDISSYHSWLYHSEVRVSDYNWMSAQGDTYKPTAAAPASAALEIDGLDIPIVDSSEGYVPGSVSAYFADPEMRQVSGTLELGAHDSRAEVRYRAQLPPNAWRVGSFWWGHDEALNRIVAPALQKADPLHASQGMSILQYARTQTVVASVWPWSDHVIPVLARGLFLRTSSQPQATAALPNVKIFFQSTGRSSGPAMTMTVVNLGSAAVNVVGQAFALEPIKMSPQDFRRELQRFPAARQVTTTLDGYCMDFAKAPPAAGAVYRLANANAQAALWPLRYLTTAMRRLSNLGALHPDTEVAAYEEALVQWSVWAYREKFDEAGYVRAFVEHGKKNIESAGRKWTKELEAALRARAAHRWTDLRKVLNLAGAIAQGGPK